jgi:ABC-type branched-subunit amino acid transport system permease subunit/ABC-type branched-subunit amino acid transport system ATPase component
MVLAIALGAALAAPHLGLSEFYTHLLVLMVIFAIFAMSLDILMGYGGLPSLGHAAFFGLAAYGVGIAMVKLALPWWQAVLVGLIASASFGAVFGLIALRTRGLYFLLITLALGQLLWGAANRWASMTGGFNGLPGIRRPAEWLLSTTNFYYVALAVLVVLAFAMNRLVESPFGLALRALSDSESRLEALGYHVWLYKYLAFILTGVLAGAAGAMNVLYNGFVSPRDLSIAMSAEGILMVILGGTGTLWGPLIGAVIVVALRNILSIYFDHWLIMLGAFFIFVVLLAPDGLIGWFRPRKGEGTARQGDSAVGAEPAVGTKVRRHELAIGRSQGDPPVLAARDLRKLFGGMRAVANVTLAAYAGERVVLLGPNGAGKTTLFHMISGGLPPDSGDVLLFGHSVNRLSVHRRARLGVGRTFQITNLFPRLTVADHLRLCAIGLIGRRLDMWRRADRIPEVEAIVEAELRRSGLWELWDSEVRFLAYGHQRQLEVAMAVAMKPKLLLLDEPAAGLSPAEIESIIDLIVGLDQSLAIILVEHDMDVAFAVADRVIVVNHGEIVAQGSPAEVRGNAEVRRIYLGRRQ